MKLEGVDCNCLIDTGSQVTTISQSFYNQHLFEHSIKPVSEVLEIEGANGQKVPYTGYVQVNIQFPREFVNSEPQMHTLALIVPDTRSNGSVPVIIGTNTLDSLYEQYCNINSSKSTPFYGYAQILKTLQLRHQQISSGNFGIAKLKCHEPKVVPANQKIILECCVNRKTASCEQFALIEQPTMSSLPGGIFIDSCLISLPETFPFKILVQVKNETDHNITIPMICVIAELTVPQVSENSHLLLNPTKC